MIYMENLVKQRYYLLFIEKDLFNTWCLIRAFGSLVSNRGRKLIQSYENEKQAWAAMSEFEYKKRQRGYIYADVIHNERLHLKPQLEKDILLKSNSNVLAEPKLGQSVAISYNPNQQELF